MDHFTISFPHISSMMVLVVCAIIGICCLLEAFGGFAWLKTKVSGGTLPTLTTAQKVCLGIGVAALIAAGWLAYSQVGSTPGPLPPAPTPVPATGVPQFTAGTYTVAPGQLIQIPISGMPPALTKSCQITYYPRPAGAVCNPSCDWSGNYGVLFSSPAPGTYLIGLYSPDGQGGVAKSEVIITVTGTPTPPGPPTGAPSILVVSMADCLPCRQMQPIIAELQGEGIAIKAVEVTDSTTYNTPLCPTLILYGSDGKEVGRKVGVIAAADIKVWIATAKTDVPSAFPKLEAK
jgi:hypothetical protein